MEDKEIYIKFKINLLIIYDKNINQISPVYISKKTVEDSIKSKLYSSLQSVSPTIYVNYISDNYKSIDITIETEENLSGPLQYILKDLKKDISFANITINQITLETVNIYTLSSEIIRKEIKKETNTFYLQTFQEDTYPVSNYSLIEYIQNGSEGLYHSVSSLFNP